jgi:hypothetical protein
MRVGGAHHEGGGGTIAASTAARLWLTPVINGGSYGSIGYKGLRWVNQWTLRDLGGWSSSWVGIDDGGGLETGEVGGAPIVDGVWEVEGGRWAMICA